jgi:hypothetical protein
MFHNERGSIFYKHVHDVSYSGIDELGTSLTTVSGFRMRSLKK